jgi:PAS domain-containing protein
MTKRASIGAVALKDAGKPTASIHAGLDALNLGFAIFDRNLKLVAHNKPFVALRGYPAELLQPGMDIIELYRFNAERGDYGPGDAEAQAMSRIERVRERHPHELEYALADGRILNIRYSPIENGGLILSYADITERKQAELARISHTTDGLCDVSAAFDGCGAGGMQIGGA